MLSVGQSAPIFIAESTQGIIALNEYVGKRPVVLIFYPVDETPGCTAQLCAVRDAKEDYAQYDAFVAGINPASLAKHSKFADHHNFDFPLVHDEGGKINEMYGVGKMLLGLLPQKRTVYVIGLDGKIAYAKRGLPPTEEILQAISSSQRVE
ncbi:peroxiredoxin [Paenibacillus sp. J2TS4]|uniref:peroxiredoxin n=1 Tax=Paenibacillus sp. J2TS4 TaxID=2807194 RepID=UPI001B278E4A|nr:peroxiredoxin [Paenibacillus sp. J2TS4]GIP33857.1 peroxiredoxin [Paenibacillus sp. J2TS4]